MSYYNRLLQLEHTLKTFEKSSSKNFEVVVVDDFSNEENSLENLPSKFPSMKIKVIDMRKLVKQKTYCNPCVPYNMGFRNAIGDKIIIQNPECCHVGDLISFVEQNLVDSEYLSFHCWASSRPDLKLLHSGQNINIGKEEGKAKWYNHQLHRPVAYHFTSAITKKDLSELNGFDESFSMGFNYDDNEFVERIKNKNMNIRFIDSPMVIHQYHGKSYGHPDNPEPTVDNFKLLQETIQSKKVRAENKESL